MADRYSSDVLQPGWQQQGRPRSTDVPLQLDLVVEDPSTGYVGAVVGWENGLVILEDRRGAHRAFPVGPGFWIDGKPVNLCIPSRQGSARRHTASGSLAGPEHEAARVALPSRIYVEGRHDAELVEKVWGDDLRHVGVVVEYMGGMDDLVNIVADFRPGPGHRLGVLIDHLVAGTKESRIAGQVAKGGYGDHVMITGHRFIDVWQAIKPERIGRKAWPEVPMDEDFKLGTLKRLGLPHESQSDVGKAWQAMLAQVRDWHDLDPRFNTEMEKLIDFVTADHMEQVDE
ncbi:DUF3097 domain-containing protein [Acidipropionibacterium jensenii]|uniref:DUF3097 domain-containing protein n=4 Tax=Acidipropionibacterium jensenii TaxID=1749 RepID=UPI002649AFEF|nr:DUF3097 domain-containing protein [Acidipropionibacterium jensenii]MDN5995375.1 DUF3097 domain-containing protein [Acidipropionibacterium jensenii]MDN6425870.1 DUF3097 domain-containing protein [Acidipropionibacterium jensenii]MDN6442579.1 DUF3097 domain-containing protein [Acidipropionibacterium jensenii]MDN6479150.1 DUF3097 domain-containing protein [Acidipropionibacterium jensenii]MDN6512051.1 DUF3097 domain-containing protein [Acidipropionibacterium jensenii]